MGIRFLLFSNVTQSRLVVSTDILEQPISPIFKVQEVQGGGMYGYI